MGTREGAAESQYRHGQQPRLLFDPFVCCSVVIHDIDVFYSLIFTLSTLFFTFSLPFLDYSSLASANSTVSGTGRGPCLPEKNRNQPWSGVFYGLPLSRTVLLHATGVPE